MTVGKRYLLDANVFIQAHRTYYAFDICPGFWASLIRQHEAERVFSIDRVKAELTGKDDRLAHWVAEAAPQTFFKGTADSIVTVTFGKMIRWAQNEQQFVPEAKAEFAAVADGWLVAYGKANGLVVVTHEEYAPEVKKKVPIPNVCTEFGVEYCNVFDMLLSLKEQFVLKTRRRRP